VAVKAVYNYERMFYILNESTERGEKIAELEEVLPENAELSTEAAVAAEPVEKEAAGAVGIPEGYLPFDIRL